MTDWETLKVTDLKEELKSRGIPLTGLKLKQQLIDKLNEIEAEKSSGDNNLSHDDENHPNGVDEVIKEEQALSAEVITKTPQSPVAIPERATEEHADPETSTKTSRSRAELERDQDGFAEMSENPREELHRSQASATPADEITGEERVERLTDDLPAELKKEESNARDGNSPPPIVAQSAAEEQSISKIDPFIPQETSDSTRTEEMLIDEQEVKEPIASGIPTDQTTEELPDAYDEPGSITEAASSMRVPTPEVLDDHRKRKRRSETPVPESQDIAQKRAKANNSSSIPLQQESNALKKVQEATDAAQEIRGTLSMRNDVEMDTSDHDDKRRAPDTNDEDARQTQKDTTPRAEQRQRQQSSELPPPASTPPERDVQPAVHSATRSLYIRNFKRPLHIPTLRSHISSLARSSDQDPLEVFYLDAIRTHAFVSFKSISAASRVRNAMHDTRFPDEPMRETLCIDFVPDEKIQEWIDQETGSGSSGGGLGGGRASSKKYEVVYVDNGDVMEAILQEASSTQSQRPTVQQSRSNRMVAQDPTASAAIASSIHPSRAPLVPHSISIPRSQPQRSQVPPRPSDPGKGFHALDELFSSTTAKPKLYYKLPAQAVIDDRLDMMRDLRVNHEHMGQSGDEGMKRYSFEREAPGAREEWVDKGPEFGFGKRGQERLTGFGSSYAGGRGRGGAHRGGSRRGGDSWRGR